MEISNDYKNAVSEKIKVIELDSECEVVPMIIKNSGNYREAHYTWALIFSILFTSVLYFSPYHFTNPINYIWSQIAGFFVGYLLAYIPSIKRLFIKKIDFNYEVDQKAALSFLNYNLHLTKNHNGVLIIVSLFERKVRILCDKNIKEKIPQNIFDQLIMNFGKNYRAHDLKIAFLMALDELHLLLKEHFPESNENKNAIKANELNDQLILEL